MSILAISPIDGRYANETKQLTTYFSEYALIKYRLRVEVEYFIALAELPLSQLTSVSESQKNQLRALYESFSESDAEAVKAYERVTNHDVKAVEYFMKEKMEALGMKGVSEFVHFGLTSQDINNTAIPMSIKECFDS